MAKRNAHSNYKGLIGNIILFERKGEQHIRVKTHRRKDSSKLVLDSRKDFKVIVKLVKNFKPFTDIGFKNHTFKRSAYHSAISVNRLNYNYAKTATGIENLDWFQYSVGNLSGAREVNARKKDDGKIEITWQGTEIGLTAHDDDKVISCIRFSKSGEVLPGPDNVTRDAGLLLIDPGESPSDSKIEVFVSFAVNEKNYKYRSDRNVSKSKWLGAL